MYKLYKRGEKRLLSLFYFLEVISQITAKGCAMKAQDTTIQQKFNF